MGHPEYRTMVGTHDKGHYPAAHLQRCVFPAGMGEEQGSEMGIQDRRFLRAEYLDEPQLGCRETYMLILYICTFFKFKWLQGEWLGNRHPLHLKKQLKLNIQWKK